MNEWKQNAKGTTSKGDVKSNIQPSITDDDDDDHDVDEEGDGRRFFNGHFIWKLFYFVYRTDKYNI